MADFDFSKPADYDFTRQAEAVRLLGMGTTVPDERTLYQRAAQGASGMVEQQGGPLVGGLSRFVIPQNEAELGAALGTVGAGGLAAKLGVGGIRAAILRILGGAGGAELGGQYMGREPGEGAATGALAGLLGETAAPAAGWATRSAPGMKYLINRRRSKEIGEVIENRVPPLAGARDPHALDQMARDYESGKGKLLEYYRQLTADLEKKLGSQKLDIPELNPNVKPGYGGGAPSVNPATGLPYKPGDIGVTISDVMQELKKSGHYGFGGEKANPNLRTIIGEEPRMEYGALIKKTKSELNRIDPTGALAKEFEANRKMAASGFTFLEMLRSPRAILRYTDDVQLNIPWLQEYVNQNQSEIKNKIGGESFTRLKKILWPGERAKMGTRDAPAIGSGSSTDVAMDLMRGVGGSPRILSGGVRMFLPSIGAQYAGRAPYTPTTTAQMISNLLSQRGIAGLQR